MEMGADGEAGSPETLPSDHLLWMFAEIHY